jgi:hypothetical protein
MQALSFRQEGIEIGPTERPLNEHSKSPKQLLRREPSWNRPNLKTEIDPFSIRFRQELITHSLNSPHALKDE